MVQHGDEMPVPLIVGAGRGGIERTCALGKCTMMAEAIPGGRTANGESRAGCSVISIGSGSTRFAGTWPRAAIAASTRQWRLCR